MFVIFGTKVVGKLIKKGTFNCDRCNKERAYHLNKNRKFFSIFFIPLIPLNKTEDTLKCTFCKTLYVPNSILSQTEYNTSTKEIDSLEKPLASYGKRIGGYFIDMIFLIFLNFPLAILLKHLPNPDYLNNRFYLVFFPVWILYFFLMELLLKGTIGKKIVSIETIVDNEDKTISAFQYLVRSIVKCIPFINIIFLFNNKRKGCHDFVSNTVVVEK